MNDGETIRSIAVKLLEAKLKNENMEDSFSRAIFVLGSKQSGKTTVINIILEKDDSQSESMGLEYSFGRKNVHGHLNEKNVCHVWELGGDMFQTDDILNIPFRAHRQCRMTVILFVDLSQPKSLWATLENCIENLKVVVEKHPARPDLSQDTFKTQGSKFFKLPMVIMGGKYDLFNEFDANTKKIVCKTLRSVALLTGASLLYFSKNDQNLKKKIKDFLGQIAFGTEQKVKGVITDGVKPLFIPSGNDSWDSVGTPPTSWESLRSTYVSQFPQIQTVHTVPDDPSLEANYKEPLIDTMRNQKDEELKILLNRSIRNNL